MARTKEEIKEANRLYYLKNKDSLLPKARQYRRANIEKARACENAYAKKHRAKKAEASREWRKKNPGRLRDRVRDWCNKNPDRVAEHSRRKYEKNKSKPGWRLSRVMSAGVWKCLNGQKSGRWFDLVGYTADELMAHLERQFTDGMSWENIGEWHVDHIIPVSSFRFSTADDIEFKRSWALTNLRPIWAKENLPKGAKILTLL